MWLGLSLGMDKLIAGIWSFSANSRISSKFRHCTERKVDTIVRIWHFMEIFRDAFFPPSGIDAIACLDICLLLFRWLLHSLDYCLNFRWHVLTQIFFLVVGYFFHFPFFLFLFYGKNSFMLSFVYLQIFL